MPTILGANTLSGGYDVANSVRMNVGSGDGLQRSTETPTSQRIFTFSAWVKRSELNPSGNNMQLFAIYTDNSNRMDLRFQENDIDFYHTQSYGRITTDRKFRDVSSWYHIVLRVDTTQGTAADRYRLYVNGVQETSFSTATYPDQNTDLGTNFDTFKVGDDSYGTSHFGGYMCEVVFCDGQSLAPTSFGEFDEDTPTVWKPIDVSGLTFGNIGFYLEFKQSGTSANSSGIGADTSGNDNHFTVNNLTAVDQSTDTCTNNFTTLNPLDVVILSTIGTFSEGNLQIVSGQGSSSSNGYSFYLGSIGLSTGKWYWEVKCTDTGAASLIGIVDGLLTSKADDLGDATYGYSYRHSNGNLYNNNSNASYGNSYSTSDIIGVYLDLDNNKLYFGKNGVVQNSGTGKDITAAASTRTGFYFPTVGDTDYSTTSTWQFNFGAGSPISVSSGNADPNGYGNFEYDPSSGTFDSASKSFYAINTKNLAEFG